jgi:oxaloacetate decarboxylase alpha subunit
MKTIKITDTSIKDIFKNSNSENINIKNFEEIFKVIDEINFNSLEVLGGSCFEKMLSNNFNKSPWEIISYIKSLITNTPLQALIGAKNLVSFDYYPVDIIKRFIKLSCAHGISVFRVYDALNNIENLKPTIQEILNNGAACQGTIIYDPVKNEEYYSDFVLKLKSLGCQSVCIKDAESMLIPVKSAELFKKLDEIAGIDIYLNTQNLKGVQILNYFEAISGNCSGIDISFIPSTYYKNFIPSVFPFLLSLKESKINHNLNTDRISKLYELIKKEVYPNLNKNTSFSSISFNNADKSLLPEWLMVMLENQLSELGELDKLDKVFEEILRIKKEAGNPSLSTPVGQIIGGQAILNTLISNKRWEIISDEMQSLLTGGFGKLPEKIDDKILNLFHIYSHPDPDMENILEVKNENLYESCKNDLKKYSQNDEDILSYCFFPDRTIKFLNQKKKIKSNPIEGIKKEFTQELTSKNTLKILDKVKKDEELFEKNEKPVLVRNEDMNNFKDLDIKKIKEIINLLESSNIEEIKIESADVKITLNKTCNINKEKITDNTVLTKSKNLINSVKEDKSFSEISLDNKQKVIEKTIPAETANLMESSDLVEIKSPIVGTFYSAPSPNEPPFVTEGKSINKGDTLCIIEAMKLMNKINSDYDGIINKILVSNEESVEYGQTIMVIKVKK